MSLVVASNRGPVTFAADGTAVRGSGGLASALAAAMEGGENTWIAAAMGDGDRAFAGGAPGDSRIAETDLGRYRLRLLPVDGDLYEKYYGTIANRYLWFALSGLFDPTRRPLADSTSRDAWDAFVTVNELFADACASGCRPDDRLLIQDYHLPLVPRMLRDRGVTNPIAHFTHTPWPALSALRMLPDEWVDAIVTGMLGADVVGFQSARFARNFEDTALAVTGTKPSSVGVFPLGPDPEALAASAASAEVAEAAATIAEIVGGRALILRVERADPAKNALRGLLAWEQLLATEPRWRSRAVHLALINPSRSDVPEYAAYEAEVLGRADRIDKRFPGSLTVLRDDDYPRSLAALRRADVLVVNSISDGQNLVAKEGPIVNERDGALVLSREVGAADQLGDAAFLVNPFDISQTADAISAGLSTSPVERARRARALRAAALSTTPATWLDGQLRALADTASS